MTSIEIFWPNIATDSGKVFFGLLVTMVLMLLRIYQPDVISKHDRKNQHFSKWLHPVYIVSPARDASMACKSCLQK